MRAASLAIAALAVGAANAAHAETANRLEAAFYGGASAHSSDISKLPFWAGLVERVASVQNVAATDIWRTQPFALLTRVNTAVNASRFVPDDVNWQTDDYWETPAELRARGGDCEDFATAKYFALRAAGVPAEAMQIALVVDEATQRRHAILLVQLRGGVAVLDNLHSAVLPIAAFSGYRPILAMNELGWQLASADLRQAPAPPQRPLDIADRAADAPHRDELASPWRFLHRRGQVRRADAHHAVAGLSEDDIFDALIVACG